MSISRAIFRAVWQCNNHENNSDKAIMKMPEPAAQELDAALLSKAARMAKVLFGRPRRKKTPGFPPRFVIFSIIANLALTHILGVRCRIQDNTWCEPGQL
ncbi:MAG TPA: hypothetical protein VGO59_01975 [Verrucomicrobiae bacterium]|jgi:hypothetical protein